MTMGLNTAVTVMPAPPGYDDSQYADYVDAEWSEIQSITLCSADIETPIYKGNMEFHQGGVYKFRQYQEKGKTRLMIAYLFHLLRRRGYFGHEVYANCWLDVPGSHWLANDEYKKLLRRAFSTEATRRRWAHTIWLTMDADQLWSHVTQADKECYEDLKKIMKCYKRNIHFLYEMHEGKGVPKYLRDHSEISMKPYPDDANDRLNVVVCDGARGRNLLVPVNHISRVHNRYDRFGDDEG